MQRTAGGVEYILTRKRVKNLNLRVRPDGAVAVSAPGRVPLREVDAFVAARAPWVRKTQAALFARAEAEAAEPVPDKAECFALFQSVSDEVFPLFQTVLQGRKPVLKVRDMRTRWGTCHVQKQQITLACRLAAKPRPAVEYVVVHEYCHFVHPNHQPQFWALVSSILPDYKARRALLKAGKGDNFV